MCVIYSPAYIVTKFNNRSAHYIKPSPTTRNAYRNPLMALTLPCGALYCNLHRRCRYATRRSYHRRISIVVRHLHPVPEYLNDGTLMIIHWELYGLSFGDTSVKLVHGLEYTIFHQVWQWRRLRRSRT